MVTAIHCLLTHTGHTGVRKASPEDMGVRKLGGPILDCDFGESDGQDRVSHHEGSCLDGLEDVISPDCLVPNPGII